MTNKEIVKAWIVVKENKRMPTEYLINVTIDRINSLTAEVLRQQAEINVKKRLLDKAEAEIERLKRKLVGYEPSIDNALFSRILLEQKEKAEAFKLKWEAKIKAKAYREFAEKLKKQSFDVNSHYDFVVEECQIDNVLKELVGDNDA